MESVIADSLDDILDRRLLRSVYQPIVDIDSGQTVAYEALARGPEGSALERPDLLFAAAEAEDRLAELDWACRAAAVEGALAAGLDPDVTLFVNVEPRTLGTRCPDHLRPVFEEAAQSLRVMVEITERSLYDDPAALIDRVRGVRELGWGIALDDVGADPASLALLPVVAPDVVKLDMSLIQDAPDSHIAEVMNAVLAYAERTGALVLAEGVEHDAHLERALSMGASLGQGWHFGRPGPPPAVIDQPEPLRLAVTSEDTGRGTPYELVAARRGPGRTASKDLLLPISMHLEQRALDLGESPLVLSAFQDARYFTPATRRRYAKLVERCALVAALGLAMPAEPVPGVRGGTLEVGSRLTGEWHVIVLGAHFAGALIAKDLGDTGPEPQRRFAYHLVYDRDLVIAAARRMLADVLPAERSAA